MTEVETRQEAQQPAANTDATNSNSKISDTAKVDSNENSKKNPSLVSGSSLYETFESEPE